MDCWSGSDGLCSSASSQAAWRRSVHDCNEAHVTLAYLLIVQGGSARGGRPLGLALAAVAFVCFDLFFLPPFGTLTLQDPLNWLVLAAFLATSVLSAQLLYRAQGEAAIAHERAAEIDKLAALGAETLNVGRAEEALTAIVSVIRSSLHVDECGVFLIESAYARRARTARFTRVARGSSLGRLGCDGRPQCDRTSRW